MSWPNWPSVASDVSRGLLPSTLGACDIQETDKAVTLQMDAPGLREENLKVKLSEGVLSITGKVRQAVAHLDVAASVELPYCKTLCETPWVALNC